jgi:pyruvate-ferredoxin/flavodoxin oxidoreductase
VLQSRAGIVNKDYLAQKALLKEVDSGKLALTDLQTRTRELFQAALGGGILAAAPQPAAAV